ncbi:MAG: formaldehyde-responsive transcriptional repressor FrmR [Chiayiivirga sp.]|jgi:DNA-binding FrmR family transcriptional regulator|uniref:formaldehyde-responsive transcriptional repressor FrmR n=1 Tax=Chiayiivirga sp. TaxID=2041042 RepID=UPI0025BFBFBF|nr:formaldehyde-responsive transcriptional repressor FrmR [Chiayiivirga sp.]MCI1729451.1 formaldehyde-responsive transcriptional repressor FrmR [Chiayiivirga sp.]
MPHSPQEKRRAITRLRRIRGQADALERAIEAGTECGAVLQQLAALRGAVNGLMAEVLESHLREEFDQHTPPHPVRKQARGSVDQAIALVRSYLK